MDRWDRPSLREDIQYPYRRQRENPSFSSTLLDAIYRSIDEGGGGEREENLLHYRETMRKKHSNCTVKSSGGLGFEDDEEMASLRRACMIEKWMEKKVSEKVIERKSRIDRDSVLLNSSSTSSDSSSGGGFSSSEAESIYSSSFTTVQRPKPIRTSVSVQPPEKFSKPKHENGFVKTKSKAMKIYGDLKKVKQPISPGGRLANFLNSLFTAGTAKKPKISPPSGGYDDPIANSETNKSKSAYTTSSCSSASSFSRSCLSKTPSSRGKVSNGTKRSVRFYPVSVIVDEDSQPCGHKSLCQDKPTLESTLRNSINEELKFHIMEKNRRVEEAARDLLNSYQKKAEYDQFNMRNVRDNEEEFDNDDEDEDDEDDAASYASSDLFELDNLSAIGIERYREELPVYETTHLDTNRAIANGLIS